MQVHWSQPSPSSSPQQAASKAFGGAFASGGVSDWHLDGGTNYS
jgi:hypothetical protein